MLTELLNRPQICPIRRRRPARGTGASWL